MAIVLGIVLVVAAIAGAWLAWSRAQLTARLAAADAERRDLSDRLAAADAERRDLSDRLAAAATERDALAAARDRAATEASRQRDRAGELAVLLASATAEAEEAAAAAAATAAGAGGDGLWHLLLAHVARRWGAVVGVPADGRAVVAGPAAEQLAEALAREIERLREEVGVDVEMVAPDEPGPGAARLGDHPDDRVPALLAALELLGVLAATAQRVTVSLGGELVLTGEGWYDPAGELATARDRVAAAGVILGPVETDDRGERAAVVVRSRGA